MILFTILAVFPALLVFFTDYLIGQPGNEKVNIKAIFFGYSFYVAKMRLKKMGLFEGLKKQLDNKLKNALTKREKADILNSYKELIFYTARPYFNFESAIGMCPICFHVWVTIIVYIFYAQTIFFEKVENIYFFVIFVLPLLVGHLILRILKKYL